ncbi:MAG: hypothetical protein OXH99_10385 [Bryobacterales bacterium]|nr:hypothetical protein [Bryobacterales bacterium]
MRHRTDIRIRVLLHFMARRDLTAWSGEILGGWARHASDPFPAQGFAVGFGEDAKLQAR